MSFGSVVRRALSGCAVVILVALSWWMLSGGVRNAHQARSPGQQAETLVQLACALLCLATAVTRFWWRRLGRAVRIAWVASLAGMAGLSALVWGPPMPPIALLFAAVALLVGWAVVLALGTAAG